MKLYNKYFLQVVMIAALILPLPQAHADFGRRDYFMLGSGVVLSSLTIAAIVQSLKKSPPNMQNTDSQNNVPEITLSESHLNNLITKELQRAFAVE